MKTLLSDGRVIRCEDQNAIFEIEAFDAYTSKHCYTDQAALRAFNDNKRVAYGNQIDEEIGRMQPEISRNAAEYVITDWYLKPTASDSIVIPGRFDEEITSSSKIISAIQVSAGTLDFSRKYLDIHHVTVEESIRFLGMGIFASFENLKSIKLPTTIESIGYECFCGLGKLEDVEIPDKVKIINSGTFGLCYNLETVQLPASLKAIAGGAFVCTKLGAVVIPNGTEIIAARAFGECKKLKQVTLPRSLRYIANDAFEDCPHDIHFLVPRGSYAERWVEDRNYYFRRYD